MGYVKEGALVAECQKPEEQSKSFGLSIHKSGPD